MDFEYSPNDTDDQVNKVPEPVIVVAETYTTVIKSAVMAMIANAVIVSIGVRKLCDFLLCNEDFAANATILTFGVTDF